MALERASTHLAAAFAFATVLAFTTHVACLTTALALAAIHAFAIVLVEGGVRGGGLAGVCTVAPRCRQGSGDQSGHGC